MRRRRGRVSNLAPQPNTGCYAALAGCAVFLILLILIRSRRRRRRISAAPCNLPAAIPLVVGGGLAARWPGSRSVCLHAPSWLHVETSLIQPPKGLPVAEPSHACTSAHNHTYFLPPLLGQIHLPRVQQVVVAAASKLTSGLQTLEVMPAAPLANAYHQ